MRTLEEILKDIKNSNQYCEIMMNYDTQSVIVTGYCGYDACRYNTIEDTELGKELQEKLEKL